MFLFLLLIIGICIFSDTPILGPQKPEKPSESSPTWNAFKRRLAADAQAREDRFYEKHPEEKAKRHGSNSGSSSYDDDDIDGSGFTGNPMGF